MIEKLGSGPTVTQNFEYNHSNLTISKFAQFFIKFHVYSKCWKSILLKKMSTYCVCSQIEVILLAIPSYSHYMHVFYCKFSLRKVLFVNCYCVCTTKLIMFYMTSFWFSDRHESY